KMAFSNVHVTEQEIINEFTVRLRNYVQGLTNWQGSTVLWSGGPSGTRNVTWFTGQNNTNVQSGPVVGDLKPDISAVASQTNALRKVIKDWMVVYSNTRRIRMNNTGNTGAATHNGVFRYTAGTFPVAGVATGTETLLNSWNIVSQRQIKRADIDALITALQSL